MSFVAVATGVSALGSVIGGVKSAKAQKRALNQSNAIEREQIEEARRQFDLQRGDLAPYREQGYRSLAQLGAGTVDGGEFNRRFTLADFEQDPGYQFRMREGLRALDASASARGGVLSGGNIKAAQQYGQELASQEYDSAFRRYQADLAARYNRLAGLAGTGQQAVEAGNQAGQFMTSQIAKNRANLSQNAQQLGNVRASQYGDTASTLGGAAINFATIGNLAGRPRSLTVPKGMPDLRFPAWAPIRLPSGGSA